MKILSKSGAFAAILAIALASLLAPRAAAQMGSVSGTILDISGKPWADVTVRLVSDQGGKQEAKTDSGGKYIIRNVRTGVYSVFVVFPPPNDKQAPYETKTRVGSGEEVKVDLSFKDIAAKQGIDVQEQEKKRAEASVKFEGLKAHFNAGNTLLEQEKAAKADLQKATPDQREAAKQKLADLADQTAKEYQAAQQAAGEKDPNQHILWAKLGEAYDTAGRNEEAVQAYQQAIAAKADVPGYYNNLGNVLARLGKIDDAKAAYTKNAELDPPNAATAWRNFGISLYTAQRMTEAIEPLKKAVELDPKNAQGWYLLATCMVADPSIYKQVGDKIEVTPKPGTVEAYQKAIDLDPSGSYGLQAKQGLENLQKLTGGIETKIGGKKKKS